LRPPRDRRREFGAVGTAALAHCIGDVGANGAEADAENAGDVAIGAAARDQSGNFVFARRQPGALPEAQQRAAQVRLQRIEKIDIAR